MPPSRHRILLIEDNSGDAHLACERLAEAPGSSMHVDVATNLAQALVLLSSMVADAIVLDLDLPDSQGMETLRRVKAVAGPAPIIVVSGHCQDYLRSEALANGAEDAFGKDETNSRLFSRSVLYVVERNRARMQQRRLEDLLDAMPDAIIVATPAGDVRFVNAAAVELFDRPRSELMAEALTFSSQLGEAAEITIPRTDGQRCCEMRVANMHWDGELVQLASIRDMTVRQQAEELRARSSVLEAQNRQFQEASRLKTEFLANMSHEIRTPMNAIIGLSHLMERTRPTGEQRSFLRKIQIASRALMGLINDVLDLSKIEAGEFALDDHPFDLPKLLRELGQMMQAQAEAKHIELAIGNMNAVPRRIRGDATRVRQILTNLLGNAIKFTERGQVTLQVQSAPRQDGRLDLRFTVRDTGIGIAPADLSRLFKPFTQADASTTRRFGGTGLGLSIVHQLSQLMGGTVEVRSEPGSGSEFVVTLPLLAMDEQTDRAMGASNSFEVLLTESSKGRSRRLCSLMRALGWHIERTGPADFSESGLEQRLRSGYRPDLWLIDVEPGDALILNAMSALKQDLDASHWPPCAMVVPSGADLVAWFELLEASVLKSTSAAGMFEAARKALLRRGHSTDRLSQLTRLEPVGVEWLAGARLMVVDDSDVNVEVAQSILERQGAVVHVFRNAGDAVQFLRLRAADVDAVLMDVQMPGMDGNAATRLIRGELGLTQLPVIALSAGAFVSERARSIDAGMVDFISKPLDPETLVRVVRGQVERARGAELKLVPRSKREESTAGAWPHIEGIDSRDVAHRLDHDLASFTTMLGRLLAEFQTPWRAAVPDTHDAEGRAQFGARMHKLRGSAGTLGATAVQRLAREAELAAHDGRSAARLTEILTRLGEALALLASGASPLLQAQALGRAKASAKAARANAGIDPGALAHLIGLLTVQDFSALNEFESLAGKLQATIGAAQFKRLRDAIDGLDFAHAVTLLRADPVIAAAIPQSEPPGTLTHLVVELEAGRKLDA